jgi:hypothetical protein
MSNVHPHPSRVNTGSAEHDSDPSTWPSWVDLWIWEPTGPAGGDDCGMVDPADCDSDQDDGPEEVTLSLPEWIEHQAHEFEGLATLAGGMIGKALRDLAGLVRLVKAHDPATAADRLAALADAALADRWSDRCN